MPLYEFECKKSRNNILAARDTIEKKFDKKILASILKKYTNKFDNAPLNVKHDNAIPNFRLDNSM